MATPRFLKDEAFRCLRAGDIEAYARHTRSLTVIDLSGTDLRATDMRQVDMTKIVLRDAYLREADLRGCDMRHMDLEGASFYGAKVSGTYLPPNVTPHEFRMSLKYGTRIRTG